MSCKEWRRVEENNFPIEWQISKIKDYTIDVTDYVANGSFATLKKNVQYKDEPDIAVLIRLVDYNNNFNGDFVYLSEESYNFLKKTKLYGGEIIITNVGANVGTVFKCPKLKYKMSLGPNAILVKTKGYDDFYYYWFKSKYGQAALQSIISGSAQPKFNKTDFRNLKIPIPPLNEQKAIAKILSDLDEKIEINNRINKVLEEIAQAIFKRWFVDFEFPNKNGEPYKSSGGEMVASELGPIPKGWEVVRLGEYISFIKGKKPKDIIENNIEGYMDYLTIDVLNNNSRLFADPERMIIVESKNNMMVMDGASSGTIYFGFKGIVASTLAKIEVINNKINDDVLFFILKYYENDIKNHTTGSAIPHADKEYIKRLLVALPKDNELIQQYSRLSGNIRSQIFMIIKENQKLSQLRDTLLPKLMLGEIRVNLHNGEIVTKNNEN